MRTNSPRRAANEDASTIVKLFGSPVLPTSLPSTLFFISILLRMEFFNTRQPISFKLASSDVVFYAATVGIDEPRNRGGNLTGQKQRNRHRLLAVRDGQRGEFAGQPVKPVLCPSRSISDQLD